MMGALISFVFVTFVVVQMYRQSRPTNWLGKLAICVAAIGMASFVEGFWIDSLPPDLLEYIELPNMLESVRLTAPDGRVFIVSSPIARVQRYGPEGFEKGFMYRRKASRFWISEAGNILICGTGELLTYSPDGVEVLPRRPCQGGLMASSSRYPSHARVPDIAFSWFSRLAVPLWSPFMAWLTALLGGLVLKLSSRPKFDAPET